MTVTPPVLGRPVGADSEQTRARIVAAAMRCVAELGHSRATIREIARTADMTSGSLYHYFPSKSALLTATVREVDEIALPRLRSAAGRADDPAERIEAVLDEAGRLMRDHPYLAPFLTAFERAERPRGRRAVPPGLKALRAILSDIVEEAGARGRLPRGTETKATVDALDALARGLTERAAALAPDAYAVTLEAAKALIRGTLFARGDGDAR
ncbi:TetR/AcrR family transcriptional regulator [Mycobacterium sp. Marseille-P9652]|uniref:TetR/AcrR family transcriptional regulator n=1 Tax=Mycobacterium sp. Marseille-P9652 TaxID=2654950 RepID=UPI0012E76C4C|nr:TetR/AcrR family transcriptional regulator [Mycobacterium sp. Marseille-P9652]